MKCQIIFVLIFAGTITFCCNSSKHFGADNISVFPDTIALMVENEKELVFSDSFLKEGFEADTALQSLKSFRKRVEAYIIKEEDSLELNNFFLIEELTIRKGFRPSEKTYHTILFYSEKGRTKFYDFQFFDEDIITDVKLTQEKKKYLKNWLNTNSSFPRYENRTVLIHDKLESYLVITKITNDESFCRLVLNPMWAGMFTPPTDSEEERTKFSQTYKALAEIARMYIMTGQGSPF